MDEALQAIAKHSPTTALATQSSDLVASSSRPSQEDPAPPDSSQIVKMVQDLHANMVKAGDKHSWKLGVPKVTIKDSYINCIAPPAKGEGDCKRATPPDQFKEDKIELPGFSNWLKEEGRGMVSAKDLVLGAGRAVGMLDIEPLPNGETVPPTDVRVLVGMYLHS